VLTGGYYRKSLPYKYQNGDVAAYFYRNGVFDLPDFDVDKFFSQYPARVEWYEKMKKKKKS